MATAATYAPRTAHPIEHFARTHHRALERWLTKHFSRQLNVEDISDVLAETYTAALETDETAEFDSERMSAWTYQVARFRAIGLIRARHGRSASGTDRPRRVVVSLEQLEPAGLGGEASGDEGPLSHLSNDSAYVELAAALSDEARAFEARRVTEAMLRLPEEQREALQYVHIDGLTVRGAADVLGTSKSSFDRLYRRALSRLHALCAAEQSTECAQVRALMQAKTALASELVGWRDAHIEGCFACQVAAGRRVKLLLPALPIIVDRPALLTRISDRLTQLLSRGDTIPAEAVAAGLGTAGASGTVAGGTLLSGLATKATVCVVTCTAAGAVTVPAIVHHRDRPPARAAIASAPRTTPTPSPAARVTTPIATTATTVHGDNGTARRTSATPQRARPTERTRPKTKTAEKDSADSGAEFSPESFAPSQSTRAPSVPVAPAASAAAPTSKPAASKSSSRSSSSFSQEFRP